MITRELVLRWFLKADQWWHHPGRHSIDPIVNSMSDGEVKIRKEKRVKNEKYICCYRTKAKQP